MTVASWQRDFDELQDRLPAALAANRPGSGVEHLLIVMPSYSVGESLLSHYADRIPSLEHRFLAAALLVGRITTCRVVFITCQPPDTETLEYYASLLPQGGRDSAWARFRLLAVPDDTARPVAAKLLDRPDLLVDLNRAIGGRLAFIEAWNVTDHEVEVACRLGIPINGSSPALRRIAFKSAGRQLFARAGVPTPVGCEDVHDVDEVLRAIDRIRAERPALPGVVIKLDDSGAGDGNTTIDLVKPGSHGDALRARLQALPSWYLRDLRSGGVVEELVTGEWFASPSVQIDIEPSGRVVVLATHEQVLGGDNAQVYMGCRFPANEAYASEIAGYAVAVGEHVARAGALGRVGIDFVAARTASGRWSVKALEINLRKGGTTHPYTTLRSLVPGRYAVDPGRWLAHDGSSRAYFSTDNAVDPSWRHLAPAAVIAAMARARLHFDRKRGTGVVLHMLSGLAIDGRFGLTAIGRSSEHASELYEQALATVAALAQGAAAGYRDPGGA